MRVGTSLGALAGFALIAIAIARCSPGGSERDMAHGTPDWRITAGRKTTHQLTDLGELAVRLGSPVSHDRRGDVIWWDDFESGLQKWILTPSGAGSAITADTVHPKNGAIAAKLVAGSNAGVRATMGKPLAYPTLSAFGVEWSFATENTPLRLELQGFLFDGAEVTWIGYRWDRENNRIDYMDSAGAWVQLATPNVLTTTAALYHTMKIVWDAETQTYVRAIFDNREFDLSGIAMRTNADATLPAMQLNFVNFGRAGQNDAVYIDDAIVTQNEP